jgi:hypothetical protein
MGCRVDVSPSVRVVGNEIVPDVTNIIGTVLLVELIPGVRASVAYRWYLKETP